MKIRKRMAIILILMMVVSLITGCGSSDNNVTTKIDVKEDDITTSEEITTSDENITTELSSDEETSKELESTEENSDDEETTVEERTSEETTTEEETTKKEDSTTTKKQEPTTTKKQEPTTTKKQEPTTTKKQEPTTTNKQEPTTTKKQEPTTTNKQEPTTTKKQEPTTTNKQEPTTTKKQEPTTTNKQEPTTTNKQEPTTTKKQEISIEEMTTIPLDIVEPPITNDNDGYWIDKELILEAYESGDISELCANDRAVYKVVVPLINSIKKTYSTDFEREKAVHDWLVLNASYDYDKYLAGALDDWDYHPYGVFVMKKGVCQSYAEAFDLCMAMLGIESDIVTGQGNGGPHAWNAVKLDGEWYQVDVTWDDPVPDVPGKVVYSYFNVTDAIMKKDHEYTYHNACNGTKYNNEYIIKTYYNLFENIDDYYTYMINEFTGGAMSASAYVKVDPDVAQVDLVKSVEEYIDFVRMKVWETKYASEGYRIQYSILPATNNIVSLTIKYIE